MEKLMELRSLFRVLLKKLWLIILLPIVAAGASIGIGMYLITPVYETSTTLYIADRSAGSMFYSSGDGASAYMQLVKDCSELVKSRTISEKILTQLGISDLSPGKLAQRVEIGLLNNTGIIGINIEDEYPQRAAQLANEVSREFTERISRMLGENSIEVIDEPYVPGEPSKPDIIFSAVVSFIAGTLLAVCLVLFLDYMDDTIKTAEDAEKYLGINVLGNIPMMDIK